jgi:hypothetical protein
MRETARLAVAGAEPKTGALAGAEPPPDVVAGVAGGKIDRESPGIIQLGCVIVRGGAGKASIRGTVTIFDASIKQRSCLRNEAGRMRPP